MNKSHSISEKVATVCFNYFVFYVCKAILFVDATPATAACARFNICMYINIYTYTCKYINMDLLVLCSDKWEVHRVSIHR